MSPGRTLVVGDVHGCRQELEDLLEAASFRAGHDALVLVGDLVAKGPDSAGVLGLVRRLKAQAVLGNHDAHVLKHRAGQPLKAHHAAVAASLSEDDWRTLEALPLWLDFPEVNTLVVHAGLLPGVALKSQEKDDLLNLRSIDAAGKGSKRVDGGAPWASKWAGPRFVMFGHDALRGLQRYPYALGLDTGCCYGKALTGAWLDSRELVSVPARREWCPIDG